MFSAVSPTMARSIATVGLRVAIASTRLRGAPMTGRGKANHGSPWARMRPRPASPRSRSYPRMRPFEYPDTITCFMTAPRHATPSKCSLARVNLVFRQLGDPPSSTYTYLLGDSDTREAILIDPVFDQALRDAALVEELGLELRWTLDTHVHADHVTGAWLLKHRTGSRIAISAASGASGADRYLEHGDKVAFGSRHLEARATPGHTGGCMTFVLGDQSMAFTGDCLLIRGSGRTDFQQGDARTMYRSVRTHMFPLPPDCLVYPAHDYRGLTATSVAEERRFNPRLGGEIGLNDFSGYMRNLRLAHPKMIDVAVPANLRCGRPDGAEPGVDPLAEPGWAHLRYSFAGLWEIDPHGLEEVRAERPGDL